MPRSGLTRIKDSGTWKPLKGLWIKDKGAWAPVQNAWTKVNGVWTKVYPTPVAVATIYPANALFSAYTSETSRTQSYTISNSGDEDLIVKAVATTVTGFTINFDWTTFGGEPTALNQITIPPGTTKSFSITVTAGASAGSRSGSFSLTANTGTLGDTTITANLSVGVLQRYSRASSVVSLSFAYDSNSAYPTKILRITNTGNQTLNISSIVSSTESLTYLLLATKTWTKFSFSGVPLTIQAGASADVTVTYNPKSQESVAILGKLWGQSGGSYSGTITINSDSDLGAITVNCDMTEVVHRTVIFTTAGTASFTVPYGITSLTYTLKGGGGGGGGGSDNEEPLYLGGGGGEGGTSTGTMTVTPSQSISYTVGAGGAGGGVGGAGGTGVTSTMNSTNALGGSGGSGTNGTGGAGGTGNTTTGAKGSNGQYWTPSSSASQGGAGGGSGYAGAGGAGGGYNEGAERGLSGAAGTAGYVEIRY